MCDVMGQFYRFKLEISMVGLVVHVFHRLR